MGFLNDCLRGFCGRILVRSDELVEALIFEVWVHVGTISAFCDNVGLWPDSWEAVPSIFHDDETGSC